MLATLWTLLVGASLVGCAGVVPPRETDPAGSIHVVSIELDGATRSAHWVLPAEDATALVVFEHGFLRHCENLRGTTRRLMAAGLMVLCIDASMRGGNPELADALAQALVDERLVPPDGRAMPRRLLVAGHSAGALFAVRLGAVLDARAPERLAGALLFDPVDGRGFEADLRAISVASRRPLLALLAPPHRCNARSSAAPVLQRVAQAARDAGSGEVRVVLVGDDATHADVEGEDTTGAAEWSCGRIRPERTEALRALAVDWLRGVVGSSVGETALAPLG